MRKKWLFILLSGMPHIKYAHEQETPLAEPEAVIQITVGSESNSTVFFPPPAKKIRCAESNSGHELKECLQKLTHQKRKKLLLKLSKQDRSAFIKNLNRDEYKSFLGLFTEQEWRTFLMHLSPSEQQRWPKNLKEQLDTLAEIKKNGDDEYFYNAAKATMGNLIFLPLPLAFGFIVTFDCKRIARNAIEKEEEAFNKYKEEKFS